MTYPNEPGYLKGSETSRAAAKAVASKARKQIEVVSELVKEARYQGTTADAVRIQLSKEWEHCHNNIASARLAELVAKGVIVKTTRKKKATTGAMHTVYVHKDYADMEQAVVTPSLKKTRAEIFFQKTEASLRVALDILERGETVPMSPHMALHRALKEYFK